MAKNRKLKSPATAIVLKVLVVAALVAGGGGEVDNAATTTMAPMHPNKCMKGDLGYEAQKYEQSLGERSRSRANEVNV